MQRASIGVISAMFVLFTGCDSERQEQAQQGNPCPGGGIAISDAWMRASRANQPTSAAYLTLCNGAATDDALIAVDYDGATAAELHISAMNDQGIATMTALTGFKLPAGAPASLEPGGAHIMLIGITDAISPGDEPVLKLRFENAPEIEILLDVRDLHEPDHSGH